MGSGITGSRGRRPEGGGRPPHPIARRRGADGLLAAAQQKEQGGNGREAAETGLQPAAVSIRPADESGPAPASNCFETQKK